MDSIIFDLDGTLWNATEGIKDTWNEVLKKYPNIREPITIEELESCMGLLLDDISRRLFPNESAEMQHKLITECCELENKVLAEKGGILFPKVRETLSELKKKYRLFVVSNCQSGYIEAFYKGNNMAEYFEDFECAGNTGKSKGENNKLVIERNNLKNPVYVGDTQGDLQSAVDANIPFVFAEYGFGNVDRYDYKIEKFADLLKIF